MLKRTVLFILVLFIATGCAYFQSEPERETVYEPLEVPEEEERITHHYYDFDDIPIPKEMKINTDNSILFESQDIRAGMLSFSGRVNSESLFNYFLVSLPNEGWRLTSYIKYGTYILTFDKPDKLCIVRIIEKAFTSELQIWISPKLSSVN